MIHQRSTSVCKILPFLITCAFTVSAIAQNGIYWSAPVEVAPATFDDKSPRVSLLSDGSPAVIWGKGSTIYFSKWEGDAFTSPTAIDTDGISPDIYSFGGIDLATAGDQVFIVFEDFNRGVFLIRSQNAGQTFELPVSVYDPPPGLWATLPSVETDNLGNPLVSVIRELTNETQGRYILMRSNDGGQTFTLPTIASYPADGEFVCECCPSDLYVHENNVFLVFRNNDNNLRDMWLSRSTDGGLNFTEATDVDDTDWVINACPISGPAIAPLAGDSLITVWKSGASGNARVSFSTIHAGSMEKGWEFEFPQTNANSAQDAPDIAGSNDTIGVVWQESGFGLNSIDLQFAFSKSGAEGLINNSANITSAPGAQRNPSLAYANGFFHLIYSSAAGGVLYQKGTVSEINSTEQVFEKKLSFQINSHPVINHEIIIENIGNPVNKATIILLNAAGQKIKEKNYSAILPGQKIVFETGKIISGIYFIQAFSGNYFWSDKIIIQ